MSREEDVAIAIRELSTRGLRVMADTVRSLNDDLAAANERAEKALSKSEAQDEAAEDQVTMCYYCGRGAPGWHCHSCWKRVLEKLVRINDQLAAEAARKEQGDG